MKGVLQNIVYNVHKVTIWTQYSLNYSCIFNTFNINVLVIHSQGTTKWESNDHRK